MVWRHTRTWTIMNLLLVLVQGVLPLAALYLMKLIVDAITQSIKTGGRNFNTALTYILIAGGVALVTSVCKSLVELTAEAQSLIVSDAISRKLHEKSCAIDLEYYENPYFFNALHRAQQEAPNRPPRIVNGLMKIAKNLFSLIGVIVLLVSLNPWITLFLVLAAWPAAFVRILFSRRLYTLKKAQTETERRAWYYHWLLTASRFAKEVRLFNLGIFFQNRFRDLRVDLREAKLGLSKKRITYDLAAQAAATLCVYGTFAYVAGRTVRGAITLGSMVMFYQAFQRGLSFLQAILSGIAGLYEDSLFLSHYEQFLGLESKVIVHEPQSQVPVPMHESICFRNVYFRYTSSDAEVLQDVSLVLRPGEVIALVGENGSGKTTLIKLLCRLYDPTAGSILAGKTNIKHFKPSDWQRRISVVFQDFVHYHLTAAENIAIGDVIRSANEIELQDAARKAGAHELIQGLPHGYRTMLGLWFKSGHELSVGEWQKIALARAFFRDAQTVILDEPTSSLDPMAEARVFSHFKQLIKGRSAIVISHRFSTVQMADRIYVLHKGRIVESGSHQDLLAAEGRYAHLYNTQACNYGFIHNG